ncbi:MAG TPA: Hsp70 family protein [Pyrinomonadaceae bacterium]|jgi:molecular chaperone DnaK
MAFHKVIGIDLGTTYSAVSVWDTTKNEVIVIPSPIGTNTVPSVVGLDPEGKVIVGAPAQNNLMMDPANTIIEVKREMGEYAREPNALTDDPGVPKKVRFLGRDFLPQEISAFILMELKRMAESYIGEPVHDAVITVPAYFKEPQKGATADAAAMARLNLHLLLNEPTAAAVCFGADKVEDEDKHIYAVYDLGGGTFDVSIIEVRKKDGKGVVSVVGTGGNSRLGGGDFDDAITNYVLDYIKTNKGVDLRQDPDAEAIKARIKREAEMRKRELSAATSATLNLPYLTATVSVNVPVTRAAFEQLIDGRLRESLKCLDDALQSAYETNGIERDEIEQVLLVGGSTRIPRIRALLAEHLGMDDKDVRCDFNPDEVVSRGAAIVAREFTPRDAYEGQEVNIDTSAAAPGAEPAAVATGLTLLDVTSHTLGINTEQSTFCPIIPKESRLPAEVTKGGFINGGPFKELPVLIFQGENPDSFDNTLIGKLEIVLPEPKERGYYNFEVTFGLDTNGLLSVTVREIKLDQKWDAQVQCNVRQKKEEIDARAEDLQKMMSGGAESAAGNGHGAGLPPPPADTGAGLPPPPAAPVPAAAPVAPSAAPAAAASVPPLPAQTPDEFRSIARRAYKQLSAMPPSPKRDRLLAAYTAFARAVESGAPDAEELGDELGDVYIECKE